MPLSTKNFKRAYIWQFPVRLFHWINAFSIAFLIITGFLIAFPFPLLSNREASDVFWMGYIRMTHFICAYLVVAMMLLRIYWAFAGNRYASWRTFFPFNKKGFEKMWNVIKYDVFLQNEKVPDIKHISIGHTNIAVVSYLFMFILTLVMIFTGFAMYESTSTWFFPKMFGWVTILLDGDELKVRMVHHFTMWFFILFIVIHVYLVFFHDWLEGRGETSSMISGHKFVRAERVEEDEDVNYEKEHTNVKEKHALKSD